MDVCRASQSLLLGIALSSGMIPRYAWAEGARISKLDLQPYLCPLKLQQPNNDPSAGVDFVTDNEVLVSTVCRLNPSISERDATGPDASDPNHLKAVLLDLTSGAVIKSFDWPTRGRGSMVRVTHGGELLVQTDNLLRTITLDGKPVAAIRLVKVGQSETTFVNSSPAINSVAVIQSSEAEGKTVNGVAVLDSHGLELRAKWHDDGESWNIAASAETAVRTQNHGSRLQILELSKASDANTDWKTVWSGSGGSRPIFLSGDHFAFPVGNSVSVFAAPGGTNRIDLECTNALGVKASRKGNLLAAACMRYALLPSPTSLARSQNVVSEIVDVYQVSPLRKLGSAGLQPVDDAAFDFALSPSAEKVAVVDDLHLSVYPVSADATEPSAIPNGNTAKRDDQEQGNLLIRTATRLVQVDAVVTDSQSRPVRDLTAADFSVVEEGRQQKISSFSYESPDKKQDLPTRPPRKPGVFTNRPDSPLTSPIVILLLDGMNTPSAQQLYVRQQMLKYLRDLKPSGARIAVLAIGNNLSVLQDFTTDLRSLQMAVQNYKRGQTQADVETPGITLTGPDQAALNLFAQRIANYEQDTRVRITLSSLQAIAQSVTGYPGRKSLIWMSSSFPFTLSFGIDLPSPFELYKSYADDVRKTTALLTDANIAVYPVDAQALLASGGVASVTTGAGDPRDSGAPGTDLSAEAFKSFRGDETMNSVADDTGGRVFRNTNDLTGAIKAAVSDSESRYVLGFYLDQKKVDGKFHTLRVKVNRPGLKVRSRTGYFALDADNWRRKQDVSITPELRGLAATGVLFEATPTAPNSPGQPARVDIVVDASTVSFGLGPEFTHPVDLSFEVAALRPDGKPEHVETRSAAAELKDSGFQQFMQTGIPLQIDMPLPPGNYLLRVTIRDNRTGHIGSLDMPLSIG